MNIIHSFLSCILCSQKPLKGKCCFLKFVIYFMVCVYNLQSLLFFSFRAGLQGDTGHQASQLPGHVTALKDKSVNP